MSYLKYYLVTPAPNSCTGIMRMLNCHNEHIYFIWSVTFISNTIKIIITYNLYKYKKNSYLNVYLYVLLLIGWLQILFYLS